MDPGGQRKGPRVLSSACVGAGSRSRAGGAFCWSLKAKPTKRSQTSATSLPGLGPFVRDGFGPQGPVGAASIPAGRGPLVLGLIVGLPILQSPAARQLRCEKPHSADATGLSEGIANGTTTKDAQSQR